MWVGVQIGTASPRKKDSCIGLSMLENHHIPELKAEGGRLRVWGVSI